MDSYLLVSALASNAERIRALAQDVGADQARWRPDPASWSILEVINHLLDEECYDFRVRLDIILNRPDEPWPPIDPRGWVIERGYNERELGESLQNFLEERKVSLTWLRSRQNPNWDALCTTQWGSMRAGDMLSAWANHDTLHLRQLVELHHAWVVRTADPYDPTYAGEW